MTEGRSGERDWWLRTLLVLQAPRAVFQALRDDSPEATADRAEPILAIILLAGMASVLSTRTAAHLLNDPDYDSLLVAVWVFIAGSIYGTAAYWVFGWFLHRSGRSFGSVGSYRRARHVLVFAEVPIAVSLLVLPVKLALYGDDLFRTGGDDHGPGRWLFHALFIAAAAWGRVKPTVVPVLAGGGADKIVAALKEHRDRERVALFGHEPDVSELTARLLGAPQAERLAFKKGGAALFEVSPQSPSDGRLLWFVPQKVLRHVRD